MLECLQYFSVVCYKFKITERLVRVEVIDVVVKIV